MTAKVSTNSQARKSLAEQIDRLDAVLDGLADGINDTVVAAVKEAVAAAVQAVLSEVLSSPELLARLGAAAPAACRRGLASVRTECGRRLEQARGWASGALQQVRALGQFKYQLLTAL